MSELKEIEEGEIPLESNESMDPQLVRGVVGAELRQRDAEIADLRALVEEQREILRILTELDVARERAIVDSLTAAANANEKWDQLTCSLDAAENEAKAALSKANQYSEWSVDVLKSQTALSKALEASRQQMKDAMTSAASCNNLVDSIVQHAQTLMVPTKKDTKSTFECSVFLEKAKIERAMLSIDAQHVRLSVSGKTIVSAPVNDVNIVRNGSVCSVPIPGSISLIFGEKRWALFLFTASLLYEPLARFKQIREQLGPVRHVSPPPEPKKPTTIPVMLQKGDEYVLVSLSFNEGCIVLCNDSETVTIDLCKIKYVTLVNICEPVHLGVDGPRMTKKVIVTTDDGRVALATNVAEDVIKLIEMHRAIV